MQFYDVTSRLVIRGQPRVWTYVIGRADESEGGRTYRYLATQLDLNCEERSYRTIAFVMFTASGAMVERFDGVKVWESAVPQTAMYELLKAGCEPDYLAERSTIEGDLQKLIRVTIAFYEAD